MIDVRANVPLDDMNTLRLPSIAARYAEAPDESALVEICRYATTHSLELLVLGAGSNVVLTRDFPGLVVRLTGSAITCRTAGTNQPVRVTAEAGGNWHDLVQHTLQQGLGGLENLALIPGTVGAAPVQNIGAYGIEIAERLTDVRAWHVPDRTFHVLGVDACDFGYRDSRFKREPGDWIITSVTFELGEHLPVVADYSSLASELARRGVDTPSPTDVRDAVIAVRQARLPDPALIGNVGSFFQNPIVTVDEARALTTRCPGLVSYRQPDGRVKLAAGWLIDQLGFRGHREDGVGVHAKQALVLVHEGGSSGAALMALAERIGDAVEERYGVRLALEPRVI